MVELLPIMRLSQDEEEEIEDGEDLFFAFQRVWPRRERRVTAVSTCVCSGVWVCARVSYVEVAIAVGISLLIVSSSPFVRNFEADETGIIVDDGDDESKADDVDDVEIGGNEVVPSSSPRR